MGSPSFHSCGTSTLRQTGVSVGFMICQDNHHAGVGNTARRPNDGLSVPDSFALAKERVWLLHTRDSQLLRLL